MKTNRKRIRFIAVCAALSALVLSALLSSCASSMEDSEAREILTKLVPLSQELNEVFWGEGLPLADPDNGALSTVTGAQYREVSAEAEYTSIAQIKEAAGKVFSADYLEQVYATAFGEYEVQTEAPSAGGETEKVDADELGLNTVNARYTEEKGTLYINISYKGYTLGTEIFPETAKVESRGAGLIVCLVDCRTDGADSSMRITLREQDGVWLLDSPTY